MMSTNAAKLKGKMTSFKSEILASKAGIFTIQQTHFTSKGKAKIEDFETFKAIRKKDKGGDNYRCAQRPKFCVNRGVL